MQREGSKGLDGFRSCEESLIPSIPFHMVCVGILGSKLLCGFDGRICAN